MRHHRTDPACIEYNEPRTPFGGWWLKYGRGKICRACFPATANPYGSQA